MIFKKVACYCLIFTGILTVMLGTAHNFAPLFMKSIRFNEAGDLWLFEVTGTAILFAGLLVIFAAMGLRKDKGMAFAVGVGSGIFLLVIGISANIMIPTNWGAWLLTTFGLISTSLSIYLK